MVCLEPTPLRFARFASACLLLAAVPLVASGSDAATIARQGNGHGAAPCMACHGADGGGQAAAGFPRLAGLNADYVNKQLADYASGARTNSVMGGNAKALSVDEREALAWYYSKLPIPAAAVPSTSTPPAADGVGALLATRGRWAQKVPGCVQCHGPRGVGVGAHFPPLLGQPPGYIVAQLKAWQTGTRKNDPLQLMQHVAAALSDADMRAVAAWFAAQPLPAKGVAP